MIISIHLVGSEKPADEGYFEVTRADEGKITYYHSSLTWEELIGEIALITMNKGKAPTTSHAGVGKFNRAETL